MADKQNEELPVSETPGQTTQVCSVLWILHNEELLFGVMVSWGNSANSLIMYFLFFFPDVGEGGSPYFRASTTHRHILESSQTFTTNQDEECSRVWHLNLIISK